MLILVFWVVAPTWRAHLPGATAQVAFKQLPDFEFVFKGSVDARTRSFIRTTAARSLQHFTQGLGADPTEIFVVTYGRDSVYSEAFDRCGEVDYQGSVRLFLASSGCLDNLDSPYASHVVAHEVFHVLQNMMLGTEESKLIRWDEEKLPIWFMEGSADLAAAQALDRWGIADYEEIRERKLRFAAEAEVVLEELTRSHRWTSASPHELESRYALSFLAVERLVGKGDWAPTLSILPRVAATPTMNWEEPFQGFFGLSVTDFYQEFDHFQDVGFDG